MLKYFFPLILIALVSFAACLKETLIEIQPEEIPTTPPDSTSILDTMTWDNPILFCGLQVGQKSRYILFTGEEYFNPDNTEITYQPDTLIVEIVSKDTGGFMVKEYPTPGSSGIFPNLALDSVLYYYLKMEDTLVHVIPLQGAGFFFSRLFFSQDITLNLLPIGDEQTEFAGWKTKQPSCACYREAWCENCEILGKTYPRLNIVTDNTFMQVDGPGFTFAYSNAHGLVRSTIVNPWTQAGGGWDLLMD